MSRSVPSNGPQERLAQEGARALSDADLLALLLRSGSTTLNVHELAARLLKDAGSLRALLSWNAQEFSRYPGIGQAKAAGVMAALEVARRVLLEDSASDPLIDSAERAYAHLRPRCEGLEVEKLWVLCMNRKHHLIKCVECSSGTANASLVHPREVFREAIRLGASELIVAHNHPSGDPSPSAADKRITAQLREAAKVLDIPLLDHIIVGRPSTEHPKGFYSFEACRFE